MKKKPIVISVIIVVVLACIITCYKQVFATYEYEPVRVNVPAGTPKGNVKKIFTDVLGYDFGSKVAVLWSLQGGTPESSHGSYVVKTGDKAWKVARNIAKGRQTPVRVTFNNLRFVEELAAKMDNYLELDSAQFIAAADTVLSSRGYTYEQWQGAFMPDTYEFYWTTPASEVVSRLNDHARAFWTPERTAKAESLGMSPMDMEIIASIVEEESNRAEEHGKVGRLYINRIQDDRPLQADPTIKFVVHNFALRRIFRPDTKKESPYNTYLNKGLPPGPIRIPEGATIDSVLNSKPHPYYFMCASPDFSGRHVFAKTFPEHRQNAVLYHRALDRRGVK
ncbi:MAG: endolytic transglycosylase MltG [Bacteroidales bacterium]|nr:endolytic transglycosylase MltG [Bacteroidales bacterium]